MNLKYKIALTMLATLNLRLYPMQKDINNNNNNNINNNEPYSSVFKNIPIEILMDILDKTICFNEIQDIVNQNI